MKDKKILNLVAIGMMAALCFIGNYIQIPLFADTRIHFGNVFIILSGLLFGPVPGGLAAGIGAGIYDLFDPRFLLSAPTTFLTKFAMGYVCGYLAKSQKRIKPEAVHITGSAIIGQLTYIVLYLGKTYMEKRILGNAFQTVMVEIWEKLFASSVNAIIAVAVAVPLYFALLVPMKTTAFKDMIYSRREDKSDLIDKLLIIVILLCAVAFTILVKILLK